MINYLPPEYITFSDYMNRLYPNTGKKGQDITLQITEDCCMKCTYCYQHKKTHNKMTFDIAKKIIDKLLNNELVNMHTDNLFHLTIEIIGGEPLMEIDLIEQIVQYTFHSMIKLNHPWLHYTKFSICSNGLLYNTPKVQQFFKKYNGFVRLAISIDGNKELHDKCRIDLNNNGTYDRVMKAAKIHQQNFKELPGTKMTFAPSNITYVYDAIINLINEGYEQIQCNCVFEKGWSIEHSKIYYNELKKVADYLINNNLYNKINVRIFDEKGFCPMDENDNQNYCGGINMIMASFDYKGDIYPCVRYMQSSLNDTQEPIKVGNINIGYLSNKQEKENYNLISNITRRSQSTDECFYCPIAKNCAWCSAYNYEIYGTPDRRTTYNCIMHKAETLANVYYWNTLYKYLNINKTFKMYIPKEWALEIIDKDEYNFLYLLSEKGEKYE